VAEGLRNLVVTVLHQDRDGFLWVGTENGLYRYDGHRFLAFSVKEGLPGTDITLLYETADGKLWVGTDHGLAWRSGTAFVASRNEALRGLIYRQAFA
jgi:ligand-binding sensor domain-containing protein